jgi:hypothetical protein
MGISATSKNQQFFCETTSKKNWLSERQVFEIFQKHEN